MANDPLGYAGLNGNTAGSGGFGPGNLGLQPQPGSGDSLTAWLRSLTNLTGTTGANLLGAGGNTTNLGLGTVGQGLETMQPSVDFWSKLLSGDPATMTSALSPTSALIGKQFQTAAHGADSGLPMGGYRSQTLADLPFAQAGQVGNAALGLQPQAAQALGQLAGLQGQLGLGVAGVGGQQTGQGLEALQAAIGDALQKMQINQQGGFASQFGKIAGGIGSILGGVGSIWGKPFKI